MKATQALHNLGQSIWLDNITRDLLDSGTLKRYINELSVTGLTSNPTIFDQAIKNSSSYDAAIREKVSKGKSGETLFFELALEDLTRAAILFRPIHDSSGGVDGWVSLEVSPLLAYDTPSTLAATKDLHTRAAQPNLFIKIPGTKEGLPAIEEAIFAGVPINVTLLFSREQSLAAAEAFLRGVERRIGAGLPPGVGSVASIFISRWDVAVTGKVPDSLRDQLGIISGASETESLARQVPDNGGVYFVPAFSGLFAPYWRSDARGAIVGLSRFNTNAHLARATLEAICYQSRDVSDAMEQDSGVHLEVLKVDGGVTANDLCMQLQADILGVPVSRPVVAETTALGAAYAAGLATGFWANTDELKANWNESKRWNPEWNDQQREDGYAGWKKAVQRTLNWVEVD